LPIIIPTILALWAIEFNKTIGEYDISILLAPSTVNTLGMTIQSLTTDVYDPNAKAISFVYAVIMMIISSLVVWLVYGRKSLSHNNKSTVRLVKKIQKMREAKAAQE